MSPTDDTTGDTTLQGSAERAFPSSNVRDEAHHAQRVARGVRSPSIALLARTGHPITWSARLVYNGEDRYATRFFSVNDEERIASDEDAPCFHENMKALLWGSSERAG